MVHFAWRSLGLVFNPATAYGRETDFARRSTWMQCYAQNPTPVLFDECIRVYANVRSRRDANGNFVSRIGFVDLDRNDPTKVLDVCPDPIISLGGLGEFDEFGTMAQSVVPRPDHGEHWLYYVGWTRKISVPYDWAIGLARSSDGGRSFARMGRGPVLGATMDEPFLLACPSVRWIADKWHMWYAAGLSWQPEDKEPIYRLFHAVSDDGINWTREGVSVIPGRVDDECQTSPSIIFRDGAWYMFFSYRFGTDFRQASRGYRIGCAMSDDLVHWQRVDDAFSLEVTNDGWDSEMACYPCVIQDGDRVWMFYCGNHFGEGGFGVAELESC